MYEVLGAPVLILNDYKILMLSFSKINLVNISSLLNFCQDLSLSTEKLLAVTNYGLVTLINVNER